mmetsp:Transcript_11799/g.19925  ORF Transcript_11799/g.19925 Transcript_11799/m.19925 type:complete len:96 (+) Transcript_11799:1440-1727(+)
MDDKESASGITWVFTTTDYKNTTESMQISSPKLLSPVDFMVKKAAGMLYCKFLSPARILEWIMVDSLKKNYYWVPFESNQAWEGELDSQPSFLQS